MLSSNDIRTRFINFWTERGHKQIPNVSLVPQNDPTLLFVNSGMFPLVPYLSGEKHPMGTRLVNFQRCIRTEDIDEVADNRHHTMFEMLGNWSLGDYFKKEQIPNVLKLYIEEFKLDQKKLYVTVFAGNGDVPLDEESIRLWQEAFLQYGIKAKFSKENHVFNEKAGKIKDPDLKIFAYKKENWWQRGEAAGELGGPSSEVFYDTGKALFPIDEKEHINSDSGRFLEIGNNVFLQYKLNENMQWKELPQKNVDFGGGFERIVAVVQGVRDNYETDLFKPIIEKLEKLSGLSFSEEEHKQNFRIIADHIRASTFLLGDEVIPSNKDQGYILRRLIRRSIRFGRFLNIDQNFTRELASVIVEQYKHTYPQLEENEDIVFNEIEKEEIKFRQTLERGLKELGKVIGRGEKIDGEKAFWFYETYGFPFEMIIEELKENENFDEKLLKQDFESAKKSHQELSRAGAEQKFKGGLADHSEETTRLHTAHHILLGALQKVLGPHVHQRGSNITNARLRIDFSHTDKLTPEQLAEVEKTVNQIIDEGWTVEREVMPKAQAEQLGAEMEFGAKYGDLVTVYSIKRPETGEIFSREFCGGPHVQNTKDLLKSGKFKIIKQESSGAGVRRIKATLEK